MDLEQGDHCLICWSEIPSLPTYLPTSSVSLLDKHLEVIFLLRKVLDVPVSQLAKYLEGCPNVEGWISLCDSCAEAVKQCKLVYQELLETTRKWRKVKQDIVGVIKVKREEEGAQNQRGTITDGVVGISENTRFFVKSRQYEDSNNSPFVAGDLTAAEELQKRLGPVVKKEGTFSENASINYSGLESDVNSDTDYNPEAEIDIEYGPSVKLSERKRPKRAKPEATNKSKTPVKIKTLPRKRQPPGRVSCHICGRTLSSTRILRWHLYSKHAVGKPPHQCNRCHKAFPRIRHFQLHLEACVKSDDLIPKNFKQTDDKFMSPGTHFRVKCPVPGCSETWPVISAYRNHFQSQHTPEEKAGVDKYPKILECLTCGKLVRDNYEAKRHLLTHDEILRKENEVVCEFCGVSLVGKSGLLAHQKKSLQCRLLQGQTEGEATVVCDVCGNRFANPATLRQHVRAVHQKNFRHQCEHCPKRFLNKAQLKVHLAHKHGIVEDKNVELKCPVEECGKIFYHKHTWRHHLLAVHKQGEPGYKCDECGKAFYTKANWKDHLKGVHKQSEPDQKCGECGKAFYTHRRLSQHVNIVHRGYRYKKKGKTGEDVVVN